MLSRAVYDFFRSNNVNEETAANAAEASVVFVRKLRNDASTSVAMALEQEPRATAFVVATYVHHALQVEAALLSEDIVQDFALHLARSYSESCRRSGLAPRAWCEAYNGRTTREERQPARVQARGLYEALGLAPSASADEIRAAFRRLAAKFHPDRNPNDPKATAHFKKINAAYQTLSDPKKRAAYDAAALRALPSALRARGRLRRQISAAATAVRRRSSTARC